MGVQKVAFAYRCEDGLRSHNQSGIFTPALQKKIQGHFNRSPRPWKCPAGEGFPWLGFWPVLVQGDWVGCYALGKKTGEKKLNPEEEKLMELLADRTGWYLEQRRLREALEVSERQSMLGFLSAAMVHEIRNPLAALSTLAQLLPEKKNDASFMESFERLMLRETGRLADLTDNFLSFLKPAKGKIVHVNFSGVLTQTIDLLKPLFAAKKVKLRIDNPPGLSLTADEDQIRILILNLMKNALESVSSGGVVEVSTVSRPISTRGFSSGIEFKIKNDGTGISPENLRKIFSPYFSLKEKGAGLGLAICQKIVENHQGTIKAGSSGHKTLFQVSLPAAPKNQ